MGAEGDVPRADAPDVQVVNVQHAGQAVGCPTALVLSGVSTREQAEAWEKRIDIIAADLSELIG
ncbi:MAG: hypothetical protein OHK0041_25880 [Anaerolineales bacterium]